MTEDLIPVAIVLLLMAIACGVCLVACAGMNGRDQDDERPIRIVKGKPRW